MDTRDWAIAFLVLILASIALNFFFRSHHPIGTRIAWTPTSTVEYYSYEPTEARLSGVYTSPLLECGDSNEIGVGERAEIEKRVSAYIETAEKNRQISKASVYFRDLSNGPWFGIHERDQFVPASLLKLPIAMSYYRAGDSMLDAVPYDAALTSVPDAINTMYGSSKPLRPEGMSARELIGTMLIDSSNEAASLLAEYMGTQKLIEVYKDFGIEEPRDSQYTIDVKTYAAFFRVLYNASYVSPEASEKLLDSLAQSNFHKGLVAGVPKETVVSHKFGVRDFGDGTVQLHDCGIVYAPKVTYVLCVMTQGKNLTDLERTIGDVSRITYETIVQ